MEGGFARYWGLPLRLVLGICFMIHGAPKLFSAQAHQQFEGLLAKLGVPLAPLMAWVVGFVEFFGGIALLLGLLTWVASLLLAIDMIVAILLVHLPRGFSAGNGGWEFPLLYLAGVAALFVGGPGALSVDDAATRRGSRLRAPWWRERHAHA